MAMIGTRVQSCNHEVGSVIVRRYIGNGKRFGYNMFSRALVGNINVLSLWSIDWVLSNVDSRGIICDDPHVDSITE